MNKLIELPRPHTHCYLGVCDYPVYKLEIVLDDTMTLEQLNANHEMRRTNDSPPPAPMTKEQQGKARRDAQRWENYTTGNAYVLYVQNRTSDHSFRVQAYGKNVFQAVRRYYRGLTNDDNWEWKCTKVVAVYTMLNRMTEAGELLCGQAQDSFPY